MPKPSTRCNITGCKRDRHARGLCGMHYDRYRRTGGYVVAQAWVNPLVCDCPSPLPERTALGECVTCRRLALDTRSFA